jgi:hypothetical protein
MTSPLDIVCHREGLRAAELFAVGRALPVHVATTVDDLCARIATDPRPKLLSLGSGCTVRDLSRIVATATAAGVACGFIDGSRGLEAAEAHAAALLDWTPVRPSGVVTWLDSRYSALGDMDGRYGELEMLGVDAKNLSRLVSAPQRVLGIVTHGNGIDAQLAGATLCGLLDRPHGHELRNYYPCGYGGACKRVIRQPDGSYHTPQQISASVLPGDVIVWGTCNGVLSADSPFDPHGGMVQALLRPDDLRQVLTTYKPLQPDESALLAACLLAEAGMPLGEVVSMLNRAHLAQPGTYDDPPWLLLGDPTAVLPAAGGVVADHPSAIGHRTHGIARTDDASADRLLQVSGSAEVVASTRLWTAPVPGNPYVVWLRDGDETVPLDVRVTAASTDADFGSVARIWGSGRRLAFTDEFFRDIAASPRADRDYYPSTVAEAVSHATTRMRSLEGITLSGESFSGWSEDLAALAADERWAWSTLHTMVYAVFRDYVTQWGRTVQISQGNLSGALADHSAGGATTCGYCGSRAAVDRLRMRSGASARSVVRCDRCMVVSDADHEIGAIWLDGPEAVTPGVPATYRIRLDQWPSGGVELMTGTLVLQRPIDPADTPASTSMATPGHDRQDLIVDWTPPADLDPGVYDVYGLALIDGAVALAKRQLVVLPREGAGSSGERAVAA